MVDKSSFINFFLEEDLIDVREDLKLSFNSYKIIFVVDTYDILNYALPFLKYDITSDSNKTYRTNAIFYESVFSNTKRFSFILPDEYRNELSSVINSFNDKLKNFTYIKRNLLDKLTEDFDNNGLIDIDDIINNIELFTILYIFYESGKDSFERFKNFIDKDLHIDSFKSSDSSLNKIVSETFENIKSSELTTKMFNELFEQKKYSLLSYNDDLERFSYLDNTYRDISVIDRIYHSNLELNENKIILRYLSSVPKKTKLLFKILKNQTDNEEIHFNRNINQLYLYNFLLEKYPSNRAKAIETIETMISFKHLKKSFIDTIGNSNNITYKIFASLSDIFESYQKEYDKSFYFDSFILFKNKLIKAINAYNNKQSDDIINILKSLSTIDDYQLKQISIINNISPILKIDQTYSLAKKFKSLSKQKDYILIRTGNDIIKNTFQHLPYMFFCNFNKSETITSFHYFLNIVSNFSNIIGYKSINFKDEFELVLNNLSISKYTLTKHSIDFLILSFLNIITDLNLESKDENKIIEGISKQKELLSKALIKGKRNIDSIEIVNKKSDIIKEFDYILLWLYRRNKQFNKAIHLYNYSYKNIFAPRFKQGIGLNYHSYAYDYISQANYKKALEYLLKSKKILLLAFNEYTELETSSSENFEFKSKKILLIKQKIGILNTIIDANNRIIDLQNKIRIDFLIESRKLLSNIKNLHEKFLKEIIDYSALETINHSETELEYFEAKYLYEIKKYDQSIIKLNYTIERIPNFNKSIYLVNDSFKMISSKINELRIDIYRKVGLL